MWENSVFRAVSISKTNKPTAYHNLTTIKTNKRHRQTNDERKVIKTAITLKMTTAQVVEMSLTNNSLSKDYLHPNDHAKQITDTPGFKPFTIYQKKKKIEYGKSNNKEKNKTINKTSPIKRETGSSLGSQSPLGSFHGDPTKMTSCVRECSTSSSKVVCIK